MSENSEKADDGTVDILGIAAEKIEAAVGTDSFAKFVAERLKNHPRVLTVKTKARSWIIGFGPYFIAPGQTVKEFVQAKVLFKTEKGIYTGDETSDLRVLNFWVGQRKQIELHGDSMPLKNFLDKIGTDIEIVPTDPALAMTIEIVNCGKEKAVASFSLIGRAVLY